jgi:hypothetical protein
MTLSSPQRLWAAALLAMAVGACSESDSAMDGDGISGGSQSLPDGGSGGGGSSTVYDPPSCTESLPEVCDGFDNDCDGIADEGFDLVCGPCDGDGVDCIQMEVRGGAWHLGVHRNVALGNDKGLHLPPLPARSEYAWIANSPQGTVSKIHTASATEEARFEVGDNPSRTAVDGNGDAWIAMRGHEGDTDKERGESDEAWENVVKIDGHCLSLIQPPVPTRECIVLDIPEVGNLLRGVASDARNDIWVGAHASQEVIQLDGETGLELRRVKLDKSHPYGIAIDEWGYLWVASILGDEKIVRVDTVTGEAKALELAVQGVSAPYGIAADGDGRMWFGSNLKKVFSFDIETLTPRDVWDVGVSTRGVAVDDEGYLWAADSGLDQALQIDKDTGEVLAAVMVPSEPVGVAIDHDGFIWTVSELGETAVKIDPFGAIVATVGGLKGPYTYSDMTGSAFRVFRRLRGTYTGVFDSGYGGASWERVSFVGTVPDSAKLTLHVRTADTNPPTGDAVVVPFVSKTADIALVGRFIEVGIELEATVRDEIPNLERLVFEVHTP